MNCPVCDKPMIVLEVDQVEVDHCVGCEGTWLDAGEIELLLDGADNRDRLLASMSPHRVDEGLRPCPICENRMDKVRCGKVIVDKCGRNDGIWFDRGELRDVIEMGEFPGENRVFHLLNDVFGGGE
jgi:Zn-finger nucleic acid-binding protein